MSPWLLKDDQLHVDNIEENSDGILIYGIS